MSPLPLFDRYAVDDITAGRHRGSPTSEAAHEAVKPVKRRQHAEILSELATAGETGRTCEELSRKLNMAYTSASARLSELKRSGDVIESQQRRPTSTGSWAAVVILARFA